MKRLLLILLLVPVFAAQNADAQGWEWAKSSLCSSGFGSETEAIAYDKLNGFIYIGGVNFSDSLCLPPFTVHNGPDSEQLFFAKYDTAGNMLWYRTNTIGQAWVQNLATDAFGNLFVCGVYNSPSVSFGSHEIYNGNFYLPITLQYRNNCYFIAKYDTAGNLKWISNGVNEEAYGAQTIKIGNIAVDEIGNTYFCAPFIDSVIHVGSYTFTNAHYNDSVECPADILVVKYDSSGNVVWAETFGGVGNDKPLSIAMGTATELPGESQVSNNRIYMVGAYASPTLTFGVTTLSKTGVMYPGLDYDAFIVALNAAGSVLWAKSSAGCAYANTIAIDNNDNLLVGGTIYDSSFLTFGTDTLRDEHIYYGAFVSKFDSSGNSLWSKGFYPISLATSDYERNSLWGITSDPCNNTWVGGLMSIDTAGMLLDSGYILHAPPGSTEDAMFLVGYNSTGGLLQSISLKSGGDDGPGLVSDCNGNIYVASDSWFSMLVGADSVHSYGRENTFIAKYNPNLGCSGSCGEDALFQKSPKQNSTVSIYPNPAQTEIIIIATYNINQVTITNLLGQTVYSHQYNTTQAEIDVSGLAPGMYFVVVNGSEVKRFVKE